jgi:hypothetical protein
VAICTDVALALSVRPFADSPVALVLTQVSAVAASPTPPLAALEAAAAGPCDDVANARTLGADEWSAPRAAADPGDKRVWRSDRAHTLGENLNTFHLGRNHLAVLADQPDDRAALEQRLTMLGDFDLCEPFDRIHDAVEEAHKAGRS